MLNLNRKSQNVILKINVISLLFSGATNFYQTRYHCRYNSENDTPGVAIAASESRPCCCLEGVISQHLYPAHLWVYQPLKGWVHHLGIFVILDYKIFHCIWFGIFSFGKIGCTHFSRRAEWKLYSNVPSKDHNRVLGATTLSITIFSIMTFNTMTLSITMKKTWHSL